MLASTQGSGALEVWDYPNGESVYEDRARNYLIDYAIGGPNVFTEIFGLTPRGEKVFDYSYPALDSCGTAWNAEPIHLENVTFN